MNHALNKQSGLTFIGLVFVLGMIALVTLFALRLFPLYNEKFQVDSAMETVANQPNAENQSLSDTRKAFLRAISITNIRRFNDANVSDHVSIVKSKSRGEPPLLHVEYTATNRLFGDVQLLLEYERQVPLGRSPTGE